MLQHLQERIRFPQIAKANPPVMRDHVNAVGCVFRIRTGKRPCRHFVPVCRQLLPNSVNLRVCSSMLNGCPMAGVSDAVRGFRGQQGALRPSMSLSTAWESGKSPQSQTMRFPVLGAQGDPPQLPRRGFPLASQEVGLVDLRRRVHRAEKMSPEERRASAIKASKAAAKARTAKAAECQRKTK